ncbi:DUF7344 domain-containing protein [Halorussus limi]|uniref:DUF7344 domain-containing protein n=1 Tax=Halorussus limi TaxID=2938695 RepID=UPI003F62785C
MPEVATRPGSSADPNAVRSEFHHSHLPKLATAGWIEYDSETKTVRYKSRTEAIRSALQRTMDERDRIRVAYDGQLPRLGSR